MKKLFLLLALLFFAFSFVEAQDTIACRNGKKIVGKVISVGKQKVVYSIPPDSTPKSISSWRVDYIAYPGGTKFNMTETKKTKAKSSGTEFYLSADAGFNVPSLSYRDAIAGTHFGFRATYYVNANVGIALSASQDYNGTGLNYISDNYWGGFYVFRQYLAGATYRSGGKPGYPWVDFVGMIGVATATNPVNETGGGLNGVTVSTPGNGSGFGYYFAMTFTNSNTHLCSLTFGIGCLGAVYQYKNYSTTLTKYDPYSNTTTNTVSTTSKTMNLLLPQMYFGINFRLKKSEK